MKFIILPADDSFDMLLEANQYRKIWTDNSKAITRAFSKVTGLEFQQRHMTARVRRGAYGNAGASGSAMILPGDHEIIENKICTLMHELGHRLLGGNALNMRGLGLINDKHDLPHDVFQYYEHRHLYLFLQDAICEAFGPKLAERCAKEEQDTKSEAYLEAWKWAMSMTSDQRRNAITLLTAEALPRNRWHERDDIETPLRSADDWFTMLRGDA